MLPPNSGWLPLTVASAEPLRQSLTDRLRGRAHCPIGQWRRGRVSSAGGSPSRPFLSRRRADSAPPSRRNRNLRGPSAASVMRYVVVVDVVQRIVHGVVSYVVGIVGG